MPQSWMRRWAGVQKVSRPTLSCQEMSQTPPITLEATAMTLHQMYQGIETVLAETRSVARAGKVDDSGIESAMCEILFYTVWRVFRSDAPRRKRCFMQLKS